MNEERNERRNQVDQGWPGPVHFSLNVGREGHGEILWRCKALRAGKLYSTTLFGTKAEADEFAQRLQHVEPDQMCSVESIKVSSVWN